MTPPRRPRPRRSAQRLPTVAVTADGRVVLEVLDGDGAAGPTGERFVGVVLGGVARGRVLARLREAALEATALEQGRLQRRRRASDRTRARSGS